MSDHDFDDDNYEQNDNEAFRESLDSEGRSLKVLQELLRNTLNLQRKLVECRQKNFSTEIDYWQTLLGLDDEQIALLAYAGAILSHLYDAEEGRNRLDYPNPDDLSEIRENWGRRKLVKFLEEPRPVEHVGTRSHVYHGSVGAVWALDQVADLLSWFNNDAKSLSDQIKKASGKDRREEELFDLICRGGAVGMSALVSWLGKSPIKLFPIPRPQIQTPINPAPRTCPSLWKECSHTRFYRVTGDKETGSGVLAGYGAYFNSGGRYNRIHQASLYVGADPLAVIAEKAYYQAQDWQSKIGGLPNIPKPNGPLSSTHRLWAIQLSPAPSVVTIPSNEASLRFPGYGLEYEIFNPSHDYENIRNFADNVRLACIQQPGSAAGSISRWHRLSIGSSGAVISI